MQTIYIYFLIPSPFLERLNIILSSSLLQIKHADIVKPLISIKWGFGLEAKTMTIKQKGICLILDYFSVKCQNKKSYFRKDAQGDM